MSLLRQLDRLETTETRSFRKTAFSLVELLVVVAIIGIMASIAVPAFSSISAASGISRGGQLLGDQIILARQEATTKNRDIEVRLIDMTNGAWSGYTALQLWLKDETGNLSPLGKVQKLPEGVVISSTNVFSPLLTADSTVNPRPRPYTLTANRVTVGLRDTIPRADSASPILNRLRSSVALIHAHQAQPANPD
jgi:prepilin-type N-terminal cleavage/methylation domain-containing protein